MVLSMLNSQQTDMALAGDERDKLINEVIDQINTEFTPAVLSRPTADDKAKVENGSSPRWLQPTGAEVCAPVHKPKASWPPRSAAAY